jgi:hypothetical protein
MAAAPGDNTVAAELVTAMFMGDRSEHLFKIGPLRLRCYGAEASDSVRWLELPANDLWLFPRHCVGPQQDGRRELDRNRAAASHRVRAEGRRRDRRVHRGDGC